MKRFFVLLCGMLLSACVTTMSAGYRPDYAALATATLEQMNDAYEHKNILSFFEHVAQKPVFDRETFYLAVENDFSGFVTVEYDTTVLETRHFPKKGDAGEYVSVKVAFSRSAHTYRYGMSYEMGETVLRFDVTPQRTLLLKEMDTPRLYGLVTP